MFEIKNNEEKRNQAMSLRGRAVGSDVVIFHAKTEKALSLLSRCCAGKKQKESSLILRKAKFQAIFKFVLSSARGGAGGGKYNRISAFVSMTVLLIRRSLEKFFKKNFRDDRFCFGFAKVLALALLLTLITISESQAEETSTIVTGTCNDDETCLWKFDTSTGKMTISAVQGTGKVSMKNYACNDSTLIGNRPWENYITQIKDIVVEENITNIGDQAFQNAKNLETLTGMKDVKTIGLDSFANLNGGKLRLVELPSVEVIDNFNGLFRGQITSVDLPNIKKIYSSFGKNIEYVGLPDWDVKMPENAFANTKIPNCSNENHAACGSCGNDYVKRGLGCVKDCGSGYLGKEGRCIDSSLGCGAGYRQFENFCNRIQYTPAEAAEVLHNDNTNSVTITFKK